MPANPEILNKLKSYISEKTGNTFEETEPPTDGGDPPGTAAGGAALIRGAVPKGVPPKKVELLNILDARTINPTTGEPFKERGLKTVNVDPARLKAIISHAKARGVNPYDALAIAYQETEFGTSGENRDNWGQAWSYDPDKRIPLSDSSNVEASRLVNALKDKLDYAKRLKFDKKGEEYALQAYNGYGDLRTRLMQVGGKRVPQKFYGHLVTGDQPFLMSEHPMYGKTIISLRDEILKKHAGIKQLVDTTPAWAMPVATTQ
jgi:hypothetical protein